jgi:hypothetical protein
MAFWFVVPVVLVGVAGYTWLTMPVSASKTEPDESATRVTKRTYEPPAVEVNSKVGKEIKTSRAVIGKRPRRPRRKPKPAPDTATTNPTPPVSEPPPTSMPVDGG